MNRGNDGGGTQAQGFSLALVVGALGAFAAVLGVIASLDQLSSNHGKLVAAGLTGTILFGVLGISLIAARVGRQRTVALTLSALLAAGSIATMIVGLTNGTTAQVQKPLSIRSYSAGGEVGWQPNAT